MMTWRGDLVDDLDLIEDGGGGRPCGADEGDRDEDDDGVGEDEAVLAAVEDYDSHWYGDLCMRARCVGEVVTAMLWRRRAVGG